MSWFSKNFRAVLLGLTFWSSAVYAQEEKLIRLRAGAIATPPPQSNTQQAQSTAPILSGTYLIQFQEPFKEEWRELLRNLGVELLKSVPDDAFIAKFTYARQAELTALPMVRWIGPYEARLKIDPKLKAALAQRAGSTAVTALFAAQASRRELAMARRFFKTVRRDATASYGTIMEGEIEAARLERLAQFPAVLWVERAPQFNLFDEVAAEIVSGELEGAGTAVQALGFDGAGAAVAVADSGLQDGTTDGMHPDLAGRVDAFFHYGALDDAADEHGHGTHVSGIVAGNGASGETDENGYLFGLGVAPKAHIIAQRIFDGLGGYEPPPTFEKMTRDAVRSGAEIGSNSWGDDTFGVYDVSAMEFDALVRDADGETPGDQPYILEFSAGNAGSGHQTIGSPAVAKNVIATGAAQNNRLEFFIYAEGQEAMADFSSRGPCEDGRIKPDVVAPGTWIASLQSSSATDENAWMPISPLYQYQGGTSQSGPQVSGAAAVFVQYYRQTHQGRTPSPALVKAALINSAVDMDDSFGTPPIPNNHEGWGRVDLTELIGSDLRYEFADQTDLLRGGEVYEKSIIIAEAGSPLKVTLVYTDAPGFPGAIPALVNDLNLEVIGPDGAVYRGNQFINGESLRNAVSHDEINNVEGVHLGEAKPGEYIVRVRAFKVNEDVRKETLAVDQDFALVVSGAVPLPGQGVVALDRPAYRAPALIQVKLIDFDLAGQSTVNVQARSGTEPAGLTLRLDAFGNRGVFTGALATALGPALADQNLQIKHGDLIEILYQDRSPAETIVGRARADLQPPLLQNVASTNRFGKEVIFWTTDENANGIVRFWTNAASANAVTNSGYGTKQEVALPGLIPGATYFFEVISEDEAGNRATNNNNGQFFRFTAKPPATILVVNAYVANPEDDMPPIPVTAYTEALDQTGIPYEVWEVSQLGSPTTADLQPHRIVFWRLNDSFWDRTSIAADQQKVISDYLQGGGAFLLASMEILSRLGDTPFRTNVLHVQEFKIQTSPFEECPTCDQDRGVPHILGNDLDPTTSGIDMALDYSAYPVFELEPLFPNIGPDLGDTFVPTTNAVTILTEPNSGKATGLGFPRPGHDSKGRLVFLGFPLEAVPMRGTSPNNRPNLIRKLVGFLAPGLNGLGSILLDNSEYTVPAQAVVEVGDSDLAGQGEVNVRFYSDSMTNGAPIKIRETVRAGLFRGFITLIPTNKPPASGQLQAKHGDVIWAEYIDNAPAGAIHASALIETNLPLIRNIDLEVEWEHALISWDTSEPADALVQFGESTFLGRTAYRSSLEMSHSLLLSPLLPDRTYYYQVVSRDLAGNISIDDNGGKLYTFKTLKPYLPPWFDNMENDGSEWTVQDGDETEVSWQLGRPNNGVATQAFSPTKAWGNNLNGESVTFVQTFLISPAVHLTGGNAATLRFRNNYDFTFPATIEIAQLLLFTNTQTQPITLAVFEDASAGWELEEFDLTPYLGRVVNVVFAYELFDLEFEQSPHPGWLIDDISITVTNIERGTIVISNNLAKASFAVSGPVSFAGQGQSLVKSNVTAGTYVIEFGNVPFYQTPPKQTNTLPANGRITFSGIFSFADANNNGLSDAWEQNYFGAVTPGRSGAQDSDGDGATDLQEFHSGTNPVDAADSLKLARPTPLANGRLQFDWQSVPGQVYRLMGSHNLLQWTSYSGWIRADSSLTTYVLPAISSSTPLFFRVETKP